MTEVDIKLSSEADEKRLKEAATTGPVLGTSEQDKRILAAITPAPLPPPPPVEAPTWNGYTAANGMPAGKTPGAPTSAFNLAGGAVVSNSSTLVGTLLSGINGPSAIGRLGEWAKPTYYASALDPKISLTWVNPGWYTGGPMNGKSIHIPKGAMPGTPSITTESNSDSHMEVVLCKADCEMFGMPFGTTAQFWKFRWTSATSATFEGGNFGHIDGSLAGGIATAADFDCCAGQIRAQELLAGHIPHALFAVCSKSKISKGWVAPALHSDGSGGPIYMGQRFRLNYTDSEIAAQPWPEYRKAVIRAVAEKGLLIGDSSGNPFGLQVECANMRTSLGVADPLAALPLWLDVTSGVDWKGRLRAVA